MLLSGISVFLSTADPYVQGLSAVFVLTCALILQLIVMPYYTSSDEETNNRKKRAWNYLDDLNALEALGLGVGVLTLYLGMSQLRL